MNRIRALKEYLPDLIIFTGIFLLSFNYFQVKGGSRFLGYYSDPEWGKIIGVMAVVVGADLLIRRCIRNKNR